jgi:hypothetical protein
VQFGAGKDMTAQRVDQQAQQRAGGADPAGQQAALELHAFAGVDHALAEQRQVIGILRY